MTTYQKLSKAELLEQQQTKVVTELIGLIESGVDPWQKDWVAQSTHLNAATGHNYQGQNILILDLYMMARKYANPIWMGAAQARQYQLRPKKGSKAVYILYPQLIKFEKENKEGEKELQAFTKFKFVPVFNIDDLNGNEDNRQHLLARYNPPARKDELERLENVEETIKSFHKVQDLETRWGGDRAYYTGSSDYIVMPQREAFKTKEGLYATWLHECSHATGSSKRLKRNLTGGKGTNAYAREELVAELSSYLCCRRLQIASKVEGHASYLQSWLRCLKADPSLLFKSLQAANKACNLICGPEVHVEEVNS